jgi:hypothetical protein
MRNVCPIITEIRETHRHREDMVRTQTALVNRAKAICRRLVGFNPFDEDEKEKKRKMAAAQALYKSLGGGEEREHTETAAVLCAPLFVALEPVHRARLEAEKRMAELAKKLPVWEWAEQIHGFGALGLAQIVGEAGDLLAYENPAKLWKRMGVGLVAGPNGFEAQRKKTNVEEAERHGYKPRRRSILWNIGDSLIKKQNEYRELYLARKEYEAAQDPERSKMHNHRRAQRYMEKRLLRNLWRAWRDHSISDTHGWSALPRPPSE